MLCRAAVLAAAIVMAPPGARAADLVVWWDKGYYAQEDEAVTEIIAAFEHGTDKQVELVSYSQEELLEKLKAALEIGRPPDFAFGGLLNDYIAEWALNDRLVDLTDTVGPFSNLFDPDALAWWTVPNKRTGQRALYALPMGRNTMHLHVWKSLLENTATIEWPLGPSDTLFPVRGSFWRKPASPSRTSRGSGLRSGPSGAMRCSPPYDGPPVATRSGASGYRCQARRPTPGRCSSSSGLPTRRTT